MLFIDCYNLFAFTKSICNWCIFMIEKKLFIILNILNLL